MFKITPIQDIVNFKADTKYEVLDVGKDGNSQPVLLVADENLRLRYVDAEDFKYCAGSSDTPTVKRPGRTPGAKNKPKG